MPDETIELGQVQTILDGLSSPTDEEFVQAVEAYSDTAIASAAAKLAMEGGLPEQWTVEEQGGLTIEQDIDGSWILNLQSPYGAADSGNVIQIRVCEGPIRSLSSMQPLTSTGRLRHSLDRAYFSLTDTGILCCRAHGMRQKIIILWQANVHCGLTRRWARPNSC
jgi:hypothetical protein